MSYKNKIVERLHQDLIKDHQLWTMPMSLRNERMASLARSIVNAVDLERLSDALEQGSQVYDMLLLLGSDLVEGFGIGCTPDPTLVKDVLPSMFVRGNFACLGYEKGSTFQDFESNRRGISPSRSRRRKTNARKEKQKIALEQRAASIS